MRSRRRSLAKEVSCADSRNSTQIAITTTETCHFSFDLIDDEMSIQNSSMKQKKCKIIWLISIEDIAM